MLGLRLVICMRHSNHRRVPSALNCCTFALCRRCDTLNAVPSIVVLSRSSFCFCYSNSLVVIGHRGPLSIDSLPPNQDYIPISRNIDAAVPNCSRACPISRCFIVQLTDDPHQTGSGELRINEVAASAGSQPPWPI